MRIYLTLGPLHTFVRRELSNRLEAAGSALGGADYAMLRVIASTDTGMSVATLADFLAIPRTSARRAIDRLAHDDLVGSRQEQHDRRVRTWTVTDAGRELIGAVPGPPPDGQYGRAVRALPPNEIGVLVHQLSAILDGLEAPDSHATASSAPAEWPEIHADEIGTPGALFELWLGIARTWRLVRASQSRSLLERTNGAIDSAPYQALYRVHETTSSANDVASFLRVDQNTALRIIDRLDALGLITRERNPADRRQVVITPTRRGVDLLEAVPPLDPAGRYVELVRGLPEGGLQLADVLARLVHSASAGPITSVGGLDALLERIREHAQERAETKVGRDEFRKAMAQFLTGVSVITIGGNGVRRGITVNSLTSVSLDPPMLLVCFDRRSPSLERLKDVRAFAANILTPDQQELAARFGRRESRENPHSLDDGTWADVDGVPTLVDSLAAIVCDVEDTFEAGSHTIVLASPRQIAHEEPAAASGALGFWRSRYLQVTHKAHGASG